MSRAAHTSQIYPSLHHRTSDAHTVRLRCILRVENTCSHCAYRVCALSTVHQQMSSSATSKHCAKHGWKGDAFMQQCHGVCYAAGFEVK